jgi:hypothetical protein
MQHRAHGEHDARLEHETIETADVAGRMKKLLVFRAAFDLLRAIERLLIRASATRWFADARARTR